jgi:hypothetical protein
MRQAMDEMTFRILDSLSRDFGRPISIHALTGKIKDLHGTAYYKNTYDKIRELEKQNLIAVSKIGRNSELTLNFGNPSLTNILSEMELRKERAAMGDARLQTVLSEIKDVFRKFNFLVSASAISPEKTLSLNRLEILAIFKSCTSPDAEALAQKEMPEVYSAIRGFQEKASTRTDALILKESDFSGLLKGEEYNPLGEMLSEQITFLYPQNLWALISESARAGMLAKSQERINPAKIQEQDIIYNMDRFGYREMGTDIREGRKIRLECIVTSILASGSARRTEAIPIMLAKNRPNFSLLIFLSRKMNAEGKLLGLLKAMSRVKKNTEAEKAIRHLESLKIREEKADEMSIRKKMRLYNAN